MSLWPVGTGLKRPFINQINCCAILAGLNFDCNFLPEVGLRLFLLLMIWRFHGCRWQCAWLYYVQQQWDGGCLNRYPSPIPDSWRGDLPGCFGWAYPCASNGPAYCHYWATCLASVLESWLDAEQVWSILIELNRECHMSLGFTFIQIIFCDRIST